MLKYKARCIARKDYLMDTLKDTLKAVLATYVGEGLKGYSYLISTPDETGFAVITVGMVDSQQITFADLIVRLI